MEQRLTKLTLKGFASIAEADIAFNALNVMIGANGAGKSNLIHFFQMLNYMLGSPTGNLQIFIAEEGGAASLLHDGPKQTSQIEACLTLETSKGINEYRFRLFYAGLDTLVFADEACRYSARNLPAPADWQRLGDGGHREAALLLQAGDAWKKTARTILNLLRRLVVYQFHDTSNHARIKRRWDIDDARYLKHDGANLAAFVLRIRNEQPKYYARIVETIRQFAPFFDDFDLESDSRTVLLQWRERGSDVLFSASQASDGTLRAMALTALLLQPPENLPSLLILDEPELGLHPHAITIVGELINSVAQYCQVLIATQSPVLLDKFSANDIIVVERRNRRTDFQRMNESRLAAWLEDYSLSDLWDRNVLGGRPHEGFR